MIFLSCSRCASVRARAAGKVLKGGEMNEEGRCTPVVLGPRERGQSHSRRQLKREGDRGLHEQDAQQSAPRRVIGHLSHELYSLPRLHHRPRDRYARHQHVRSALSRGGRGGNSARARTRREACLSVQTACPLYVACAQLLLDRLLGVFVELCALRDVLPGTARPRLSTVLREAPRLLPVHLVSLFLLLLHL